MTTQIFTFINYTMDTTTALTLVIPEQFHDEINTIRKEYDRAFPRWAPHINFCFPFLSCDKFDDVVNKLQPVLKSFGSFELNMTELGYFKQGKNVTVNLRPEDDTKLKELFNLIKKTMPNLESKHDEFNPHMTLAQFKKGELDTRMTELQEWLKDKKFTFVVDHICILQRSKTDNDVPFSVARKIMLC